MVRLSSRALAVPVHGLAALGEPAAGATPAEEAASYDSQLTTKADRPILDPTPTQGITDEIGVRLVDSVPLIAAGQIITPHSPGHLTIAAGSPGRSLIESSIKRKVPFVFSVTTAPRMESGSQLPSGSMDIVSALLGLGVR